MNVPTAHSTHLREFVEQVQRRTGIEVYAEAHELSRATLQVLGQSISGGEAKQLARWLPPELHDELAEQGGQASGFDKRNFIEKVGVRVYSVDVQRIENQIRATLQAVRSTTTTGELDDTIAQLPTELAEMFA